jgi:hypothetical protein
MLLLWMERRIAKSADVRTLCPNARFGMEMGFVDVDATLAGWMYCVCADLAG